MQWMGAFVSTPPLILFYFWCIPFLLFVDVPRHLKSAGHYGKPAVQKFALCVCPFVTILFPLSILSTFQPILFKLYVRVDIGKE